MLSIGALSGCGGKSLATVAAIWAAISQEMKVGAGDTANHPISDGLGMIASVSAAGTRWMVRQRTDDPCADA